MSPSREAIIELFKNNFKNTEILKLIKIPRTTAWETVKGFKEVVNL